MNSIEVIKSHDDRKMVDLQKYLKHELCRGLRYTLFFGGGGEGLFCSIVQYRAAQCSAAAVQ